VVGEYQHTCFANNLAHLIRLPGAIRDAADLLPEERSINSPREAMRLVHWLMGNGVHFDDLFARPADQGIVHQIRECLDTGAEFPFATKTEHDPSIVLAFGDTLLQLLSSLTEPVVPASLHAKCAQMTSRDEAFELLDDLPSVSVNVWISVTAFLHFIAQQASPNDLESAEAKAKRLASVFTPILLRDDPTSHTPVSPVGKRAFLLYFIT